MNFSYSNHALEQMKLRNLSMVLVEEVLKDPDEVIQYEDLSIYQAIVEAGKSKKYLIRVFVNIKKEPALVVTVYRTSKIDKYYESEI
jgi:hypothetical protein